MLREQARTPYLSIHKRARGNPGGHPHAECPDHVLVLDKHVHIGREQQASHGRPHMALKIEAVEDDRMLLGRRRETADDGREELRYGHAVNRHGRMDMSGRDETYVT